MEERLAEYRARKRKEELIPSLFKKVQAIKPALFTKTDVELNEKKAITKSVPNDTISPILHRSGLINNSDIELMECEPHEQELGCPNTSWLTICTYILYFLLWATVYAIAINLEFGTVFLIVSLIYFLWKNTRTGPKKKGEVSAYSVFNPNCEAIDGSLKAEQFEQEIRYGAASVH